MFKLKLNIRILVFLCIFLTISTFLIAFRLFNFSFEYDRRFVLNEIQRGIKENNEQAIFCKRPDLAIKSPEIMKFIKNILPLNCSDVGFDWVKCKGSVCYIEDKAKSIYGKISCSFTDIIWISDEQIQSGEEVISEDRYKLINSDFVKVSCTSNKTKWSAVLASVRKDETVWKNTGWEKVPPESLKMNVLIFGLDSISHNMFIRKLPKSYEYLSKVLNAVILEGYNIVGDGTPQALIPMLTGKTELELPDTRKRFYNSVYVDSYPLIWKQYRNAGYVTGYLEDLPTTGIFTYRLNGFENIPTDHYMRTYYLADIYERKKWSQFCTGDKPSHTVMLNFITDFFQVYQSKPRFLFGFHGELSHDDINNVQMADNDIAEFLQNLNESGHLNNTVLIVMADHGHRFASIRNTIQGKLEERLPFFSITLPPWFKNKHPNLYNNLKSNAKKLCTPFDIHATLENILNIKSHTNVRFNRSISLFDSIPSERTCSEAFIEPHWCACLTWNNVNTSSSITPLIVNTVLSTLNNYTSNFRNLCDIWTMKNVRWLSKLVPNKSLVKFKQNKDRDGFLGDFTSNTVVNTEIYQINLELNPESALFEASVTHNLKDNTFKLKMSDISRINMYGKQARCIENTHPFLRKYCHCKN